MKKILLTATALSALTASAFAADLPSRKEPVVPPPPPLIWTGFYAGVNVGGTVDASSNTYVANGPVDLDSFGRRISALGSAASAAAAAAGTAYPGTNNSGFIGGGQVGYNYQFGAYTGPARSWVVGIEADIQGVTGTGGGTNILQGTALSSPPYRSGAIGAETYASKSLDYIGTVRGRIGALINPALLVYATGGLAYGGANSNTNQFEFGTARAFGPFLTPAWSYAGSYSDTRIGWTAGAGLEWMFWSNWSLKFEYLYYDLGSVTYSDGIAGSSINVGRRVAGQTLFLNGAYTSAQFNGHIFRAGVNYHFNWAAPAPVLAKY